MGETNVFCMIDFVNGLTMQVCLDFSSMVVCVIPCTVALFINEINLPFKKEINITDSKRVRAASSVCYPQN